MAVQEALAALCSQQLLLPGRCPSCVWVALGGSVCSSDIAYKRMASPPYERESDLSVALAGGEAVGRQTVSDCGQSQRAATTNMGTGTA